MSLSSTIANTEQKPLLAFIFGAGSAGVSAFQQLKQQYKILGFIDNDTNLQGSKISGVTVYAPQHLLSFDHPVFIASEYYEQIVQQLGSLGIEETRILATPSYLLKPVSLQGETEALALVVLASLSEQLELANLDHHIDAGTLLGMMRDGKLIPWDDDLDFSLDATYVSRFEAVLPECLVALEQSTGKMWRVDKYTTKVGFGNVPVDAVRSFKLSCIDDQSVPTVDVFIKYRDQLHSDYCLASRGIRMPARFSNKTERARLGGIMLRIPVEAKEYLRYHYGADWEIPNPNWSLADLNNTQVF